MNEDLQQLLENLKLKTIAARFEEMLARWRSWSLSPKPRTSSSSAKRLKPLLRILLPALERHGHLKLDEPIRARVLAASAATIDRLLRAPHQATRTKKRRRVVPEIRRRVRVRTFADWNEPPPGSMEKAGITDICMLLRSRAGFRI
jgi:hypothetical protein